jgi:hypothetical protein
VNFKSTEETIGWFRDRYLEGSLIIKPPYQRNPVWLLRQKCHLVESVLKGLPIPELFVQRATTADGDTTYSVVDGQQRIRSVLQFVGADDTEDQAEYDRFELEKLETTSPWYGLAFLDLKESDRKKFYGYALAVRYLDTDDEEDMKDMFRRLNRFTSPLKPQELRNATYEGPFAQLANRLADDHSDFLAENRIISAASIRRMADVELIAELIIGVLSGPQAGSPRAIDSYYEEYEDFEDEFPGQRKARRVFERTLLAVQRLFPDLRDNRWSNKTDFYSLVVALAQLLPAAPLSPSAEKKVRAELTAFEASVEKLLANDKATVKKTVSTYVRNVQRGANDKARRAARHSALVETLRPFIPQG